LPEGVGDSGGASGAFDAGDFGDACAQERTVGEGGYAENGRDEAELSFDFERVREQKN